MSLLAEIRNAATDSRHSLTDALRKGLILASLLKNNKLKEWLKRELEGYPNGLSVPAYRIIDASIVGNLANEYGYPRLKNARYPTEDYPDEVRSKATMVHMTHGVRELEQLGSGDEFVCLSLPPQIVPSPYVGMKAYELWHQFHRSAIDQVLDSIRTRLLELVLDLEEKFPEMKKSEDEIAKVDWQAAASVVNLHIHGSRNVIAAGSEIAQTVTQQIREGDVGVLADELLRSGVPENDVKDLRSAIADDGKLKDGKLGPKVAKWVGNMTMKALEGTVTAAPTVIVELVKKHFGL